MPLSSAPVHTSRDHDRFGVDGALVWHALRATRDAAIAASAWSGRGDPKAADEAATSAMRAILSQVAASGTVVTGEGAKDDAPMLADGEQLGTGGPEYDIAVDPLECTDLCACGLPGAMATIALAPRGSLWTPGPAFYMDKLVLPPAARDAATLDDPPAVIAAKVAEALGKPLSQLRVSVLDKPRHGELIAHLRAEGVAVSTPIAGDVGGALSVLLADGDADLLLGVGGTPEGVLTACAVRALGGGMYGRLAPQRDDERQALADAGMDVDRVLTLDDLAAADATFIATGITGGLLAAPCRHDGQVTTESVVIAAGTVHRISQTTTQE